VSHDPPALKKTLGPLALWGLGVGYVISGEYFGWNLGLPLGGTYGMLVATLLVTLMYVCFVFSYAELACAIPRAGGAFVYCARAFGPLGGMLAGVAQLVEFVFAPPAIAMAIAAYVTRRIDLDPRLVAVITYLLFTGLNAWGVKQAALFELFVTVLAVAELLLFAGIAFPSFDAAAFARDPLPHGWFGVFECLPFAIWFYLAIEGVANAAEEAKNPQRDVAFGFGAAMLTLAALALIVFFSAVGVAGWQAIVYAPGSSEASDAPLPLALLHVVDNDSALYTLLLSVGVLGLVASFHGILLAAARATMELGRAGYAPAALGSIHAGSGTPRVALAFNMLVGLLAIVSGRTAEIITLSVFGALALYVLSMSALFRLRALEPELERPFRAHGYPWVPAIALVLSLVCAAAMTVTNWGICALFMGLMLAGVLYYRVRALLRAARREVP
jgi:ethanolamine permease